MKAEYRDLRLKQLTAALAAFDGAKQTPRPQRGWLYSIRQALGMSRQQVANAMRVKQQSIVDFEEAEADDRITLRNLRRVAEAMDCELVYAIVPKSGTIVDLAEKRARDEASKRVRSVEHTMALEDQASGNVDEAIAEETKRILKRKR
jgi:predicted DNA-binding mobile mystery protein A